MDMTKLKGSVFFIWRQIPKNVQLFLPSSARRDAANECSPFKYLPTCILTEPTGFMTLILNYGGISTGCKLVLYDLFV